MNPKTTFLAAFAVAALTFILSVSADKPAPDPKAPPPFPPAPGGQPVAIDRDAMLRDMAARSAIADLNRTIDQRKRQLYTENPKIAELQEKMRQNQAEIDKILDGDEELKQLREKHETMISDMPSFGAPGAQPMVMPAPFKPEPVKPE